MTVYIAIDENDYAFVIISGNFAHFCLNYNPPVGMI